MTKGQKSLEPLPRLLSFGIRAFFIFTSIPFTSSLNPGGAKIIDSAS